jgi:hypothetical protein
MTSQRRRRHPKSVRFRRCRKLVSFSIPEHKENIAQCFYDLNGAIAYFANDFQSKMITLWKFSQAWKLLAQKGRFLL